VQKVFPRVIPTGLQHGTVTVRHRGVGYEVTTLRGEGAYSDGRRPDHVEFVSEVADDLGRRDFTINAIAYDPVADRLDDPYGGLEDLERRVIRAVGDPLRRFSEDGLRVLRAARFAASLEFEPAPETEAAIRPTLETFQRVSAERVRDEWLKAFKARAPSRAFEIMRRTGILEITWPALSQLDDATWLAAMRAVDAAPLDACMRLAALSFPLRDDLGAIADWLTRYRYSNAERERILRLVEHAWPKGGAPTDPAAVRRHARRVGRQDVHGAAQLGLVLAVAFTGEGSACAREAAAWVARLEELVDDHTVLQTRELALSGRELMQALGLAPGPRVGQLLDALLDHVLEEPRANETDALLEYARTRLSKD